MSTNEEIIHENRLIEAGRKQLDTKQRKAQAGQYTSKTRQGHMVISTLVADFASNLSLITAKACQTTTGRSNISHCCLEVQKLIDFLSAERIAFAALVAMVNAYSKSDSELTAVKLAASIGRSIEHETRCEFYQKILPEQDARSARRKASMPGSNARYRRYGSKRIAEAVVGKQFDEWNQQFAVRVGTYLIEIGVSQGVAAWKLVKRAKSQSKLVDLSALFNQILGYEEYFLSRSYLSHPLIAEPLPWEFTDQPSRHNNSGGYHLPELRRQNFMCRSYDSETRLSEHAIELLNTLQRTAMRVDLKVLEVAEHCIENFISVGSKFVVTPFDRPPTGGAPEHVVDSPELLKEWKKQRSQMHKIYTEQERRSRRTSSLIQLAKTYKHKTFYLSWSCDWRGRMYPQQPFLQSQGPDYERALLKFRDGCKLNADGIYWVKAAIGAAFNGSRLSHQQRIKWTEDNHKLISLIAENPLQTINEWEQAKDPWQFLQLCFEWNEVVIKGTEKFWKVPIGSDSTSSGLQLLSGMRRDPVGMKFSNLLEPEHEDSPPLDAYLHVLEVAKEIASSDFTLTHLSKYLNFRNVGKPVLMVSIYGGKADSIKPKIKEALADEEISIDDQTAKQLVELLTKASKKVFPAAFEALRWLEKLAKAAHKNGSTSITWSTPTSDLIHLYKYKLNETTKVYLSDGSTLTIANWDEKQPDLKKQVTSFAPSFVHSFDAALCKEAFTDWNHPLALIHDCIRVLPNDMDRANDRIRDAFCSIVDGDPLSRLADDLGVSAANLKRLEQLGEDLQSVSKSRYMFN